MQNKNKYGVCGVGHSALIKKLHNKMFNKWEKKQTMTENKTFKQGDKVTIHSLGDGKEYNGEVNGITAHMPGGPENHIYIVKILSNDGQFKDYKYSHFSITGACLKLKEE